MSKDTVIVYTDRILSGSATFIRAQAEHVKSFSTVYVGTKRVPDGLDVPDRRSIVLNEGTLFGRFREGIFKMTGVAPIWKRRIQRQKPSLIHAHFAPDGLMALPIAEYLDIPLLVTFQGYGITIKDEYAKNSFYRHRNYVRNRNILFEKADKFIAVSKYIKDKAIDQGCNKEKIEVLYTGTDIELFSPSSIGSDNPIVLFVGRIVEKKGLVYLIKAMEKIQKEVEKEVELVVIGDGKDRRKIENKAYNVLERVKFLGFKPPNVVRKWMDKSMMLVVPSITAESGDSEGLPNVVFEGQSMGLPVIGSRHAGIPEAVVDGKTGYLFPEKDWRKLAEKVKNLITDKELRMKFGKRARKRMKNKFSLRKQSKKLEDVYEKLIK